MKGNKAAVGVEGWMLRREAVAAFKVSVTTLKRRVRLGRVRVVDRAAGRRLYWVEDLAREFGAPGAQGAG